MLRSLWKVIKDGVHITPEGMIFLRVGAMAEKPHFFNGQNSQHVSSARPDGMGKCNKERGSL